MAYRYMYSQEVANKLPGSNQRFHFRTVTRYEIDSNGKATGNSTSQLYYTPVPAGRTIGGQTWRSGNKRGENFQQAAYVLAAESTDGGATWTPKQYTAEDARVISGIGEDRVGENVLGATALQSLQTPGGRFYDTAQNSIINTAVQTEPGLAPLVASKLKHTAPPPPVEDPPALKGNGEGDAVVTDDNNETEPPKEPFGVDQISEAVGGTSPKNRNSFPLNLKYPRDLADQTQDYLKIEVVKHIPTGFGQPEGGGLGIERRQPPGEAIGRVYLPIASGIKDVNAVEFGRENMNVIQAEAAFASLNIIQTGDVGGTARNIAGRIRRNSPAVKNALEAFFAGAASGTAQQVLQRAAGAVFNPNMELLFRAPQLRPFNFSYKLSARSREEGDDIIKIIRMLKQASAVQRTTSNLFLKSPHTFRLAYMSGDSEHKYLNRFKECALQSLQVEYAPEGTYATFSDGKMVSYQISMTFQELEPVFNDDYHELDQNTDTMIGF